VKAVLEPDFSPEQVAMFGELVNQVSLLIVPPRKSLSAAGTGVPVSQPEPTGQLKLSVPN
jgi:hypothetical protein